MEIKEIKERLGIDEVVRYYGHAPTKKGMMVCPYCGNHEKSRARKTMQIYVDSNRFKCFHTKCEQMYGRGDGDIFDFIERTEKCSKGEAIVIAKKILGVDTDKKVSKTPKEVSSEKGKQLPKGEEHNLRSSSSTVFNTETPSELYYRRGELDIQVLGGINIYGGLDKLRVTLKLSKERQSLRHSLDLYYDDQVQKLIRKVAERLNISTTLVSNALYELTDLLEEYRRLERKKEQEEKKLPPLTLDEKANALSFLKQPDLIQRTSNHLGKSGIVGEAENRLILYLTYSSRKQSRPLHVICLGASGTGKTYLQEKVSALVPEDEKYSFTTATENALYYLDKDYLRNKLVVIEDLDGSLNMLYHLRELQSKQYISKSVPLKDNMQGDIQTRKLELYGPISLTATTTKERIYEDNANRCLLIYLDDSEEQEEAIMDYQRKLSAGTVNEYEEQSSTELLINVQRVLKPIKVINPYAEALRIPKSCFKPLRTHAHYLQFIETVTYYHQYQRAEKVNEETGEVYIETTLDDIQISNSLLKDILLAKSDELPKVLRTFFEGLKSWLKKEKKQSFYAKDYRDYTRMYRMKLNRYLRDLEGCSMIKRIGGNKKVGFEYEVVKWDDYERLSKGVNVLDELLDHLRKTE